MIKTPLLQQVALPITTLPLLQAARCSLVSTVKRYWSLTPQAPVATSHTTAMPGEEVLAHHVPTFLRLQNTACSERSPPAYKRKPAPSGRLSPVLIHRNLPLLKMYHLNLLYPTFRGQSGGRGVGMGGGGGGRRGGAHTCQLNQIDTFS